jgi:hypothetical protein
MKSICVYHHLGLGDHFICNGLVRTLADKNKVDFLYLPTKKHNFSTVSQMYSDDIRIICLPVDTDEQVYQLPQLRVISGLYRIGFENCRDTDWDISFYDIAGLPFDIRWNKWKCNRDYNREKQLEQQIGIDEPYILVHDTGSNKQRYNLEIETQHRIVRLEPLTTCLLDWYGVIEKAREMHCIDSSVIHLAQSIRSDGVFHKIRDLGNLHFCMRDGWLTKRYK